MSAPRIRPYVANDREACLAIFDSNTPDFFGTSERELFVSFLDKRPSRYYVVEDERGVVACGGWGWKDSARVAVLTWGMVHRTHHRSGLGRRLLRHRLAEAEAQDYSVFELVTSQHSAPFFAREGFVEEKVEPNLFAPGLHGHHMRRQAPSRILAWDGCSNVRDLGHLTTRDGRRTRWAAIVRADDFTLLTSRGRDQAVEHGVRTVIDLRLPTEMSRLKDDRFARTRLSLLDPEAPRIRAIVDSTQTVGTYRLIVDTCGERFVSVLRAVGAAVDGGVAIHCQAGRDRTGLVVAMILSLANVDEETIVTDYALSDRCLDEDLAPHEAMRETLRYLRETFGGVEGYLRRHGATEESLMAIRTRLT